MFERFRLRLRILQNRFLQRTVCKLGRRGFVLATYCVLFLGQALAFITNQVPTSAALKILNQMAPTKLWGVVWLVSGLFCLIGAVKRKLQPLGFAASTSVMTLWGVVSWMSWILGDARTGWVAGLIYGMFALKLMVIAGWRENDGS